MFVSLIHRLKSAFIIAFGVMFLSYPALAQNQFPEFTLSDKVQESTVTIDSENTQSISIRRPLTRDILMLQEQINILEALVSRQSEIEKIAKNYKDIGLPFIQPTPELGVCEKLPLNVLCFYSYPDLDKNKYVFENATERLENKQNEAMETSLETLTAQIQTDTVKTPQLNQDLLDRLGGSNNTNFDEVSMPTEQEEEEEFMWTDIKCVQSKCTALIVSSQDSNNRYRVSNGEKIDDNIKIANITPTKVTAKIDDTIQTILPMAIDGKSQPVRKKPAEKTTSSISTSSEDQNNSVVQQTQSEPSGGLLGPTGLF